MPCAPGRWLCCRCHGDDRYLALRPIDDGNAFSEPWLLSPGGRFGVSDVVTENHLTEAERAERGGFVGCIAGALSVSDYRSGLDAAGFADVSVEFTHAVDNGVHAAVVRAVKPAASLMSGHGA